MKQFGVAAALMLLSVGTAMADQYDAVYVSDPAVCARAGKGSMGQALFDLHAAAVSPRVGIWMGELACSMVDAHSNVSTTGTDEIYAIARCEGPYLTFIDTVLVTSDSSNINLAWGDQEGTPPAMVEVISMKHGDSTDAERDPESYAGVYTKCDALTPENFQ